METKGNFIIIFQKLTVIVVLWNQIFIGKAVFHRFINDKSPKKNQKEHNQEFTTQSIKKNRQILKSQ